MLELAVVRVLRPASEESGKVAEVDLVSGSVVDPAAELVESAERGASPPSTTDSATSQSSLLYTGSQPYSCTAAVIAFVGPWRVVAGAAQQRLQVVEQEASAIAKSVRCSH